MKGASGRTAMGKPNQLGSDAGGGFGQDEELLEVAQAFAQQREIASARCDEAVAAFASCATPTAACMSVIFRL